LGFTLSQLSSDETQATTRLYLITPPALDPDQFAKELEAALAGGDVACLQLRLKEVDDDAIRRAARILEPIAQDRDVAFIMNDRPDLAAELDCDGVHVGEEDMSYAEARRLLGPDHIVGVTCGASRDRAITAAEAGADYVAFGAFFPSTTKAAKHHADPELLRDWSETTVVPCCAIGGITQQNCGPLVGAGADFLAVIGAIWSYPAGPRAAVAEFNEVFARYGRAYHAAESNRI
jgi:thiamine-phosphate pyrophosphorylase